MVTWCSRRAARPAHSGGQRWVHQGPRGEKNHFFPNLFPDHLRCSNTFFWPVLSPWWRVLGHGKSQNALKMGRFKTNIYYYTPLPLNLASKQQQQARHRSVLAIAPSHRLGRDSTLAILEPRWWPCQIQVLSQELTGGGPERWRQVGRCPPKTAQFWAKSSHFSPKIAPRPRPPKRRETVATSHVRLDFAVSKSPLVPFNSKIWPRNGPKKREKTPKSAQCAPTPRNQAGPYLGLRGSKPNFEGT